MTSKYHQTRSLSLWVHQNRPMAIKEEQLFSGAIDSKDLDGLKDEKDTIACLMFSGG